MAKLDSGRMSDATRVKQVDDQHRQFETDLEEIFGIPDNTDITKPIFGSNPRTPGNPPVNKDGSITGIPVFKLNSPAGTAAGGVGFEFDDGTERKRLVYVNSKLGIYKYDSTNDSWTAVANIEEPGSGSGYLTSLLDVDLDPIDEDVAGFILKVTDTPPYKFELVEKTVIGGTTEFTGLTDVSISTPLSSADEGKIVQVNSSGYLALEDPPNGLGDPWVMWLKAQSASNWGKAQSIINTAGGNPQHTHGSEGWLNTWLWSYPFEGEAQLVTDAALLTKATYGTTDYLNYYITLQPGVYTCALWYSAPSFNLRGFREWRIMPYTATTLDGGAVYSDRYEPPRQLAADSKTYETTGGTHYLGTKDLVVTGAGKVGFQVRQSSDNDINSATFYASITKVK